MISAAILAAAFATAVGIAISLRRKLETARADLAAARNRPPEPPPPPRVIESRRERYGLLWFPTLTVKDKEKLVVSAAAGVPNCARCVRPLKLAASAAEAAEEWACGSCDERRPASTADMLVTDSVVADTLKEFLARHDGWRALTNLAGAPRSDSSAR